MPQRRAIIAIAIQAQRDIVRVWDNACLGLFLSDAYFTGRSRTADEIAAHCGVSADTVKRWLRPLINIGRVEKIALGRTATYRATRATATKTADALLGLVDMSSPETTSRAQSARLPR
jgi:hypothetical protein